MRRAAGAALLLALLLSAACRSSANAATPDGLAAKLDALIAAYVQAGRFNGTALVARNGEVVLCKGYGWADVERRVPCTCDTRFPIASTTKTFTAVLVLQLVEEGKLSLDTAVADILPYYRKDTGSRITIRHLLSHTSGLPNYLVREGFPETGAQLLSTREFVEKYCMDDLEFEPGTDQSYANTGFVVLGAIVEELTGRRLEVVLKERILNPAGLGKTTWGEVRSAEGRIAAGYDRIDGALRPSSTLDPVLLGAGGALVSTAEDLYRWDRALAGDGLLSPAMKALMVTPVRGVYGLGWNVKTLPVGPDRAPRLLAGHDGGISGHLTHFRHIPEDGHLVVLLANVWDMRYKALSEGIVDLLYGREPAPMQQEATP